MHHTTNKKPAAFFKVDQVNSRYFFGDGEFNVLYDKENNSSAYLSILTDLPTKTFGALSFSFNDKKVFNGKTSCMSIVKIEKKYVLHFFGGSDKLIFNVEDESVSLIEKIRDGVFSLGVLVKEERLSRKLLEKSDQYLFISEQTIKLMEYLTIIVEETLSSNQSQETLQKCLGDIADLFQKQIEAFQQTVETRNSNVAANVPCPNM